MPVLPDLARRRSSNRLRPLNQVLRRSRAMTYGVRRTLWIVSSLAPDPASLAARCGLELASAALEGFFAAAQVACFAQLMGGPGVSGRC
jgi:hypothetical protein